MMGQSVCGLMCDLGDQREGARVKLWNVHILKLLCLKLPTDRIAHKSLKSANDSSLSYSKTTVCVYSCMYMCTHECSTVSIFVINWD